MNTNIENMALALFKQYGVKDVSLNEIAKRSGITKDKIFENYKSKENLITVALKNYFTYLKNEIEIINQTSFHPVNGIVSLYAFAIREISLMQPVFVISLNKHHPAAAKIYLQFQNEILFPKILPMLEDGKNKGYIKTEITVNFLKKLHGKIYETLFKELPLKLSTIPYEGIFKNIILKNLKEIIEPKYILIFNNEHGL